MKRHSQTFQHLGELKDVMMVKAWAKQGILFFETIQVKTSTQLHNGLYISIDTGVYKQLRNYRDMDYEET